MARLDSATNILISENIHKEQQLRWNHPATQALVKHLRDKPKTGELIMTPRKQPPVSAAVRYLEEKTGLVPTANEYVAAVAEHGSPRPETREFLYHGISHEGHGRLRYLQERKKYGVLERHEQPVTAMQCYGIGGIPEMKTTYTASPNARKPTIQSSFFRTMGVDTYKGLPPA
eukprot:TRINITY_DN111708_c0_g1_i1.p1 TRINITY_DN111708_c0_g1~~TRINITY_DN111708_c0_g1_i1.p1  ORF type:complete len:173 (+),score=33.47 TRINITY_DN111708_c0_g1_i1:100-618(+)